MSELHGTEYNDNKQYSLTVPIAFFSEICYLLHQLRDTQDIEDVFLNVNLIANRNPDLVLDTIQRYLTTEKEVE